MKLLRACTKEECEYINDMAVDPTMQLKPEPYSKLINPSKVMRLPQHCKVLGDKVDRMTEIIRKVVLGGHHFTGFLDDGKRIRLHYDWGAVDGSLYFQGVGYLTTEELKQGHFVVDNKILNNNEESIHI